MTSLRHKHFLHAIVNVPKVSNISMHIHLLVSNSSLIILMILLLGLPIFISFCIHVDELRPIIRLLFRLVLCQLRLCCWLHWRVVNVCLGVVAKCGRTGGSSLSTQQSKFDDNRLRSVELQAAQMTEDVTAPEGQTT